MKTALKEAMVMVLCNKVGRGESLDVILKSYKNLSDANRKELQAAVKEKLEV